MELRNIFLRGWGTLKTAAVYHARLRTAHFVVQRIACGPLIAAALTYHAEVRCSTAVGQGTILRHVGAAAGKEVQAIPCGTFLHRGCKQTKGNPKTVGFWRRFCPLLPLLAKVGRAGARNIPAPEGAEPSLPEARRRGLSHFSLYPWLRIKFTLSRQFAPPDVPSGGNPVISPLHGGNESRPRDSANSRRTRGGPLRRTGKLADSICAKRLTPRYTPGCG